MLNINAIKVITFGYREVRIYHTHMILIRHDTECTSIFLASGATRLPPWLARRLPFPCGHRHLIILLLLLLLLLLLHRFSCFFLAPALGPGVHTLSVVPPPPPPFFVEDVQPTYQYVRTLETPPDRELCPFECLTIHHPTRADRPGGLLIMAILLLRSCCARYHEQQARSINQSIG